MKAGTKLAGVECPECGSIFTSGKHGGYSPSGHRIRRRACKDCGHNFVTVEVAADFVFNRVDTASQEHARKRNAKRPKKYKTSTIRTQKFYNDDLEVVVNVIPGKPNPWCHRLLHKMEGDNVYINKNGHKRCHECIRIARRERSRMIRLMKGDAIRQYQREWAAKQGSEYRERRAMLARRRKAHRLEEQRKELNDNTRQTELGPSTFAQSST